MYQNPASFANLSHYCLNETLNNYNKKNISNKVYLVTLAELFILGKVLPDMEPALWAGDLGFPPLEMDLARVCTELFCGGTRKPWLGGPASWLIL